MSILFAINKLGRLYFEGSYSCIRVYLATISVAAIVSEMLNKLQNSLNRDIELHTLASIFCQKVELGLIAY